MMSRARRAGIAAALFVAGLAAALIPTAAAAARQSLDDVWWTGSLLAQSATTLPAGRFYTEPTLADNIPFARFDGEGKPHAVRPENGISSSLPLKYGITDRLAVGAVLRLDYDWAVHGPSSSAIGVGDPSLQLQYRLTRYRPDSRVPAIAVSVQESLPAGRYDRLDRQTDGFGTGAYATTLASCFQSFFWMPNGRIVRARVDLFYTVSRPVSVQGRSVYGTPDDFRGYAKRGGSAAVDVAFEYSASRNWVLAADFWLERDAGVRVSGISPRAAAGSWKFLSGSGVGRELLVAPAIEYNWSSRLGVIVGVRTTVAGRNETGFATPIVAFSYLH